MALSQQKVIQSETTGYILLDASKDEFIVEAPSISLH